MMIAISVQDAAIARAREIGTLRVERKTSERFGSEYFALTDDHGLIEVFLDEDDLRKTLEKWGYRLELETGTAIERL